MSRASAILVAAGLIFISAANVSASTILSENFDNVAGLGASGWAIVNDSAPAGTTDWFQGMAGVFTAQAGAPDAYIAANFEAAAFGGNISDWLISPELTFNNSDIISFWTRTELGSQFPDRLELRLSLNGSSTNVADFSTLLLSINPGLAIGGYPENWAVFSAAISGLGGATAGRFAFRYFVPDTSVNGDYIGIDTVTVRSPTVAEPGTLTLLSFGIFAAARSRRSITTRSR